MKGIFLFALAMTASMSARAQTVEIHTPELDRLRVLVPVLVDQRNALANDVINANADKAQLRDQYDHLLKSLDAEQDAEQDANEN